MLIKNKLFIYMLKTCTKNKTNNRPKAIAETTNVVWLAYYHRRNENGRSKEIVLRILCEYSRVKKKTLIALLFFELPINI